MTGSWEVVSDDWPFTMGYTDSVDLPDVTPGDSEIVNKSPGVWSLKATVAEWRPISKPGFFASTEW